MVQIWLRHRIWPGVVHVWRWTLDADCTVHCAQVQGEAEDETVPRTLFAPGQPKDDFEEDDEDDDDEDKPRGKHGKHGKMGHGKHHHHVSYRFCRQWR